MEGPFLRGGPRPIRAFCVSDPKISSTEVDSLRHRSTLAPCRLGVPNRNAGWCCSRVLPDRISEKRNRLVPDILRQPVDMPPHDIEHELRLLRPVRLARINHHLRGHALAFDSGIHFV